MHGTTPAAIRTIIYWSATSRRLIFTFLTCLLATRTHGHLAFQGICFTDSRPNRDSHSGVTTPSDGPSLLVIPTTLEPDQWNMSSTVVVSVIALHTFGSSWFLCYHREGFSQDAFQVGALSGLGLGVLTNKAFWRQMTATSIILKGELTQFMMVEIFAPVPENGLTPLG